MPSRWKIVFDPKKVSYADLLEKWFFKYARPDHVPTARGTTSARSTGRRSS